MKKLLLVLAIGAFAACNDGGSADENKTDTATKVDSAPAPAPVDTAKVDTSAKKPADTTIKK